MKQHNDIFVFRGLIIVFLDVGANIGLFTMAAINEGETFKEQCHRSLYIQISFVEIFATISLLRLMTGQQFCVGFLYDWFDIVDTGNVNENYCITIKLRHTPAPS